jgi:hypothetical protein
LLRTIARTVRARSSLALAFHSRSSSGSSAGILWGLAADELQYGVRANHGGGARLQGAPEAIADPAVGVGRGFDQQTISREPTGAQRIEPDAIGRLVDSHGKLGLHA